VPKKADQRLRPDRRRLEVRLPGVAFAALPQGVTAPFSTVRVHGGTTHLATLCREEAIALRDEVAAMMIAGGLTVSRRCALRGALVNLNADLRERNWM